MKHTIFAFVAPDAAADTVLPELEFYTWKRFDAADMPPETAWATFSAAVKAFRPVGFFSIGASFEAFPWLMRAPHSVKRLWIHLSSMDSFSPNMVPNNWIHTVKGHEYSAANPLVSVFTTTFDSGDKILRPLRSLQAQTYSNWEWVIWDDSKDQITYQRLLAMAEQDLRIKVFKAPQHSGFIGHVKRLAASTCTGQWLVEVDHDDELEPRLLQWIVGAGQSAENPDFVYCDTCEIYEDSLQSHCYGDESAFGFAGNMWTYAARPGGTSEWYIQYLCPEVNPKTLSHIVGVPNHVRAWRRDFYHAIGGHNELLAVADDYDLILRSFLHGKWCYLPVLGYWQYRNAGGNNFTFKRNALIQHAVAWLADKYAPACEGRYMAVAGAGRGAPRTRLCWHDENRQWPTPSTCTTWLPTASYETTLSIVMPTYNRPADMRAAVESIAAQTDGNWLLYIVGDKCPVLEATMRQLTADWLGTDKAPLLQRIHWWNLRERQGRLGTIGRNYALRLMVKTKWVTYLDDDNTWATNHISSLRPGMAGEYDFVLASLMVQGRPIICDRAVLGRVDSSALCHRHALVDEHGYWPVRHIEYANEIQFARPWLSRPFYATKQPTVNYNTKYNAQTYESIMALA